MANAELDKVGLILIGHGGKLLHNGKNLEKIGEILRLLSAFKIAEIAHEWRHANYISNYRFN